MSSDQTNPSEHDVPQSLAQQKPPRYVPPRWVWITSAVLLLIGVLGLYGERLGKGPLASLYDFAWFLRDGSFCNLIMLIGGFFALFIPLMWITFASSWPTRVRLLPLALIVLMVGGFFTVFKIKAVSGNMIPRFGYRWAKDPDQRLEQFVSVAPPAGEKTADRAALPPDPHAWPQFLGPERNNRLPGPKLATDWTAHPPQELWRMPIGAGWSGFAAQNGRIYTMEQRDQQEMVTCYDIENLTADGQPSPLWGVGVEARHYTSMGYFGPRCTPLLFDGRVYALGATGVLSCVDQATGQVVWQHDLLEMYGVTPEVESSNIAWGRSNSPLAYELPDRKIVIIPAGGPDAQNSEAMVSLVAFDAATGETVWEGGHQQISYASPSVIHVDGADQICSVNEATITGHDPATGKQLWEMEWPGKSNGNATCSQVLPLGNNQFFVSKGYGQGARTFEVKPAGEESFSVESLWDNARLLNTKFTNVSIQGEEVFGIDDSILEKVKLGAKRPTWRERGFGHGQVLLVGDVLLVMGEEGNLAAVDSQSDKYHEYARIKALSSEVAPTWNPMCLYGDLLLVRNAEEAACYRLATED
ncbi:hypothetical protein DTL42_13395 [Bremerella cremea]|uniref:Pyrrolo-quinoline quinone repeat domain-containing protein n=1 Tax=Bremerella cremea TaxID=1031537 RepID=A0A368KT35_9BACT|nr:PQQ-binding-like beta-propeller repeat protein [Bremerella cremea]RCS48314.1 hypothetical protein DTL42_13395 [Bremerella cremea]